MKKLLIQVTVILLLLSATDSSDAAYLIIPSEFATIQAAITAANIGDNILIEDGTYTGPGNKNLDFYGKALSVITRNGPYFTVIDCENDGRGFNLHSGESETSIIRGITIRNGYASGDLPDNRGGGIHIDEASPIIENCIITNNRAEYQGGGIYCNSATIINCRISDNEAINGSGGGVLCRYSTMTNCEMINNRTSVGGGGTQCHYSTITGCKALNNYAGVGGGGMDNTGCTISDCFIAYNETEKAGGICFWRDASTMTNTIVRDNIGTYRGGGIGCYYYAIPEIINCIITGNSGPVTGGGIYCWAPNPVITNCTITGNSAENGGGIGGLPDSTPIISNCIIWNNSPGEFYFGSGDGPEVSHSDIMGGWPGVGNIDADPIFRTYMTLEMTIGPNSPCVDTGDPTIEDTIYDWHPLWPPGYRNRKKSDMGAYGGPGNDGWLN